MIHEVFKVFKLPNGQMFDGEVNEFINSGTTLKSLSLTDLPMGQGGGLLVSIGYTNEPTKEKYKLEVVELGSIYEDTIQIEKKLNNIIAFDLHKIICQDLSILNGMTLFATFLTLQ